MQNVIIHKKGEKTQSNLNIDLKDTQMETNSLSNIQDEQISVGNFSQPSKNTVVKISAALKEENERRNNLLTNMHGSHFSALQKKYDDSLKLEKFKLKYLQDLNKELILLKAQSKEFVDLEAISKFKQHV